MELKTCSKFVLVSPLMTTLCLNTDVFDRITNVADDYNALYYFFMYIILIINLYFTFLQFLLTLYVFAPFVYFMINSLIKIVF